MGKYFKRLTKPRFLVVYPLAFYFFFIGHVTEPHLRIGILFIFLGETLRVWANGYIGHVKVNQRASSDTGERVGQLVTAGPYAFVRHPLYLGSFMIGIGFTIIAGQAWFIGVVLGAFLLIYRRQIAEEESVLFHEWKETFRRYQQSVPGYFPRFRRYADAEGEWSWKGIVSSKEWKTALWLVVFVILMYFWEETIQEHEFLFDERKLFRQSLVGLVVVLVVIDVLVETIKICVGSLQKREVHHA